MIKQQNICTIIISILIFSCNGNDQAKLSTDSMSDNMTNDNSINRQKSDSINYGAGDVVTRGYLDKSGNIWFGGRYGILWMYNGDELKDFTYEKRNK